MARAPKEKPIERSSTEQQTHSTNPETSYSSPLPLPIGYWFVPKDEELIRILHLQQHQSITHPAVHHVNVYDSNPQQLSERFGKSNEKEWFFISERIKLCKGGKNQKRGNNDGYWDAREAAKRINAGNGVIGYITKLKYYVGKKPNCVETDWRMHEYWFNSCHDNKVDYALCKIFLTQRKAKKKMKEDNEAMKKEEGLAIVEIEQPQPRYVENQESHILPMMTQEEEQQQQQQVTQSPLPPPQDPQGQDSPLEMNLVNQLKNMTVPEDDDFWNMSEDDDLKNLTDENWWNSSNCQLLNI